MMTGDKAFEAVNPYRRIKIVSSPGLKSERIRVIYSLTPFELEVLP